MTFLTTARHLSLSCVRSIQSTPIAGNKRAVHFPGGKKSSSSSSYVGVTARCGLWLVEQYLSICSYLSLTLSIFSLPTLEDFFPLLLSTLSWIFRFVSSLPFLK
jgi:hypothetical protein